MLDKENTKLAFYLILSLLIAKVENITTKVNNLTLFELI